MNKNTNIFKQTIQNLFLFRSAIFWIGGTLDGNYDFSWSDLSPVNSDIDSG